MKACRVADFIRVQYRYLYAFNSILIWTAQLKRETWLVRNGQSVLKPKSHKMLNFCLWKSDGVDLSQFKLRSVLKSKMPATSLYRFALRGIMSRPIFQRQGMQRWYSNRVSFRTTSRSWRRRWLFFPSPSNNIYTALFYWYKKERGGLSLWPLCMSLHILLAQGQVDLAVWRPFECWGAIIGNLPYSFNNKLV